MYHDDDNWLEALIGAPYRCGCANEMHSTHTVNEPSNEQLTRPNNNIVLHWQWSGDQGDLGALRQLQTRIWRRKWPWKRVHSMLPVWSMPNKRSISAVHNKSANGRNIFRYVYLCDCLFIRLLPSYIAAVHLTRHWHVRRLLSKSWRDAKSTSLWNRNTALCWTSKRRFNRKKVYIQISKYCCGTGNGWRMVGCEIWRLSKAPPSFWRCGIEADNGVETMIVLFLEQLTR